MCQCLTVEKDFPRSQMRSKSGPNFLMGDPWSPIVLLSQKQAKPRELEDRAFVHTYTGIRFFQTISGARKKLLVPEKNTFPLTVTPMTFSLPGLFILSF
jgi:hypothetical protein